MEETIAGIIAGASAGGLLMAFAGFISFHAWKAKREASMEDAYSTSLGDQPAGNAAKPGHGVSVKMQAMKEAAVARAAMRIHGTKNLAGVFLVRNLYPSYLLP